MVYAVLYVAVHESLQVVYGVSYAVVGDAALRIVVGAYLGAPVACRNHCLATGCYVVDVFLVLFVVDECAQAGEGALFVFGLVAGLGTLYEYLFGNAGIGVFPYIPKSDAGLYLIAPLSYFRVPYTLLPLTAKIISL